MTESNLPERPSEADSAAQKHADLPQRVHQAALAGAKSSTTPAGSSPFAKHDIAESSAQFTLRGLLGMTAGFGALFAVLRLLGIDWSGTVMAFMGSIVGASLAIFIVDLCRFSMFRAMPFRAPATHAPRKKVEPRVAAAKACPECGRELSPWADRCFVCGWTEATP